MTEIQAKLPVVSILIPVFNRRKFIADCVQSALNQSITNIEVVIVDNASTDGTWDICQQLAARDPRVRIFRNDTNIGPVRNWLRCVNEARGKYGKILFSDDLMFPKFLERTLPYLEDSKVAFVSTAALIGEAPSNAFADYSITSGRTPYVQKERYFDLLISNKTPVSPGAAIFRMADIRQNLRVTFPTHSHRDFSKNGAGPDMLLFALTALNYQSVVMLPEPEVFFRAHPESITILNSNNEVAENYRVALAWFCRNHLGARRWAKYVAKCWLSDMKRKRSLVSPKRYAMFYEGAGSFSDAFAIIRQAFFVFVGKYF